MEVALQEVDGGWPEGVQHSDALLFQVSCLAQQGGVVKGFSIKPLLQALRCTPNIRVVIQKLVCCLEPCSMGSLGSVSGINTGELLQCMYWLNRVSFMEYVHARD